MTAVEFAEGNGYIGCRYLAEWRGFACYEAIYSEAVAYIGIPQIILKKNGVCRMANYDEAMAFIDEIKLEE